MNSEFQFLVNNMPTTIQPTSKTETFESSDISEVFELIRSNFDSDTLKRIVVRRKTYPENVWEIIVEHEHARH